jgi:hypothetical protein
VYFKSVGCEVVTYDEGMMGYMRRVIKGDGSGGFGI